MAKPDRRDYIPPTPHGQPLAGEGADTRLRCPKDATIMEQVGVGDITIDRCAKCGAMWFDALELERIVKLKNAVAALDPEKKRMHSKGRALGGMVCPRDRSPLIDLVDQKQSHIHEKACTVCGGVLLDAGELADLSEFTLTERLKGLLG